MLVQFVAD